MSGTTSLRIIDYGPYTQSDQAPGDTGGKTPPPLSQMAAQVDFIANNDVANTLRIYTLDDQQSALIDYAINDGLNVIPSVYLTNPGTPSDPIATWADIMSNPAVMGELNNLVSTLESLPAADLAKIPFVVVGNEEISQVGGWSDTDIEDAIAYVKQNLPSSIASQLQFTTAETYAGQYMNLLNGADYSYNPNNSQYYTATNMGNSPEINVIYVNIAPYLDGVSISNAASYVDQIYQKLQALYPDKEIVISETGWPSSGATRNSGVFTSPQQSAVPSLQNEQTYLQDFLQIANTQHISFGVFEAYNEPNKDASNPTAAENNWGLLATNSGPTYASSTFKTAVTSIMPTIAASDDFDGDGTSDILFRNNSSGDTGFYSLSDGAFTGWQVIGGSSTAYSVVGVGDFYGDGTSDVLFRNNSTGDTGFYSISNGAFTGWQDIGGSSTAYSVVGVGDFYGDGTSDVLFRDNSNGDTGFYSLSNGAFTGSHDIGASSTAYSVVGVGDFYGNGTDDILFRNNTNGDTGFYSMSNGAFTGWHDIGPSSTAYSVVGVGDFYGNGTDDILFRNNTTGDTGFYAISNGVNTGWHDIGASSTAYSVVAIGDYLGNGTSDILFRNTATGDTGFYAISNGALAGWHDVGASLTAYQVVH